MGNASLECYDAMVNSMADTSLPQVDPQAWYLSIIGIHPRHQSKGLGIGLIEPVLQQTDRMQHPTFLETFTPRSIPFYERLGYEVAELTVAKYMVRGRKPPSQGWRVFLANQWFANPRAPLRTEMNFLTATGLTVR